jgi:hypothetical protein
MKLRQALPRIVPDTRGPRRGEKSKSDQTCEQKVTAQDHYHPTESAGRLGKQCALKPGNGRVVRDIEERKHVVICRTAETRVIHLNPSAIFAVILMTSWKICSCWPPMNEVSINDMLIWNPHAEQKVVLNAYLERRSGTASVPKSCFEASQALKTGSEIKPSAVAVTLASVIAKRHRSTPARKSRNGEDQPLILRRNDKLIEILVGAEKEVFRPPGSVALISCGTFALTDTFSIW